MVDHGYMWGKTFVQNNCFQDISAEKDSEVSATELVDFNYIIVCIYRSPNGNFWIFLKNLEFIVHTMTSLVV
jgi:hypothetical protein